MRPINRQSQRPRTELLALCSSLLLASALSGCGTITREPDEPDAPETPSSRGATNRSGAPITAPSDSSEPTPAELGQLRAQVRELSAKVQMLEAQVAQAPARPVAAAGPAAVTDSELRPRDLPEARSETTTVAPSSTDETEVVPRQPSGFRAASAAGRKSRFPQPLPIGEPGVRVAGSDPAIDADASSGEGAAIASYRRALVLYRSQNYPEAIVALSQFLDKHIDHALAGSAQFYLGESYLKQKENRLAAQEYERVLTSFDRSPHVAAALSRLVELYAGPLQKPAQAARLKNQLTTLFPQSPYAAEPSASLPVQREPSAASLSARTETAPTEPLPHDLPPASAEPTQPVPSALETAPIPDEGHP